MTGDTMEWFENRGVPLKTEEDNRVFPVSDSSQDIIDCLIQNAEKNKVKILFGQNVVHIEKKEKKFLIKTDLNVYTADIILIATGSNPKIWKIIEKLGHTIIPPVPSLFTFKIDDERIKEIPGVSVPNVKLSLNNTRFESQGPLLITHWGLSGPAVLKLSSFGALFLAEKKYHFQL
jgi:predicted Rossmann fold flavoprotein